MFGSENGCNCRPLKYNLRPLSGFVGSPKSHSRTGDIEGEKTTSVLLGD